MEPVGLNLTNKHVVIIGGGNVAFRRAKRVFSAGASITIVSPECADDMTRWISEHSIQWERRKAVPSDTNTFLLILAAGEDVHEAIYSWEPGACLINDAADSSKGSIVFPAVVQRGQIKASVHSGGAGPLFAKSLCSKIEPLVAEEAAYVSFLTAARELVTASSLSAEKKKAELESLLHPRFRSAELQQHKLAQLRTFS
ncbi:NAD(P)-dependent oxidoreductase [Bacillus daqingensis]|uniref:precorrin-2 dehydrogenase n=1 Tax=Bacillus daqingensis TaxID=872396 RepID=A0ABV9NTD8_9BACI